MCGEIDSEKECLIESFYNRNARGGEMKWRERKTKIDVSDVETMENVTIYPLKALQSLSSVCRRHYPSKDVLSDIAFATPVFQLFPKS